MDGSTQAGRLSGPAGAMAQPPAGPPAQAPAGDERRIRLGGRYWTAKKTEAAPLRSCAICLEGLARHHLCEDTRHAVCAECKLVQLGRTAACHICRQPFQQPELRRLQDQTLRQGLSLLLEAVVVRCTECTTWSGPLAEVGTHVEQCSKQLHGCSWRARGCDWRGLQDDLDAHALVCRWRPVACSLPGCSAEVPLCRKQEHEVSCEYAPACLGMLETNRRTLGQLKDLHQFYQQEAGRLERLPSPDLRARLQETAPLFSLLYRTVDQAAPARLSSEETCPWGCGFGASLQRMEDHYAHCPHQPVVCDFCPQRLPRQELNLHLPVCDNRPAACPRGCGARVSARDIATGWHDALCTIVVCDACQRRLPNIYRRHADLILDDHRSECSRRPVDCIWCFEDHPFDVFDQESAACRARAQAAGAFYDYRPLFLHPGASGTVYIKQPGQTDPVFLRLPRRGLLRLASAVDAPAGAWQNRLGFVWNDLSCRLRVRYEEPRFLVQIRCDSHQACGLAARAILRRSDGGELQRMGTVIPPGLFSGWGKLVGSSLTSEPQLTFQTLPDACGPTSATEEAAFYLGNVTDEDEGPDEAFLLHLETLGCRN